MIEQCPRAGKLQHLYLPRHGEHLDVVIPEDEFQLAFAGSHSRGCIFRDGNQFIKALEQKLDEVLSDFEGFNYGRLDVKFKDINTLMRGEAFDILEINGASSEAAHIWDSDTSLSHIFVRCLSSTVCYIKLALNTNSKAIRRLLSVRYYGRGEKKN